MAIITEGLRRFKLVGEFLAVVIAAASLAFGVYQYHLSVKSERQVRAVQFATDFVGNSDVVKRTEEIKALSKDNSDFNLAKKINTPEGRKLRNDIFGLMNQLEVIADGVNNNWLDEEVIRRNFDELIYIHCTAHIYGHSGKSPSAEWVQYSDGLPLFTREGEFPQLRKLYHKWFPDEGWHE